MRNRFEQQLSIGTVPISEVDINQKTRHELAPVLVGLQYLFIDKLVNEKIFALLENRIIAGKKRTGRPGMSLWEIFVLAVVRLCLDVDYDFLLDQANNHNELRGILGVQKSDFSPGKVYQYQTVVDNITLLDEATLEQINELVVKSGHTILKKKKGPQKKRKNNP